ncbi:hypothetical protein FRC01_007989 [Tulasnella sp. 417]|nr:hypothetical protein FRC01_007989 [Tulasnella sp. 417]
MPLPLPSRMDSLDVVLGAGAVVALSILGYYMTAKRHSNRPPGPPPLPVIGNMLDMPRSKYALGWAELGQKYGPVVWLAIPGQKILILNSIEATKELLDKRGSNYVDRPKWVMAGELMGRSLRSRRNVCETEWTFRMQDWGLLLLSADSILPGESTVRY